MELVSSTEELCRKVGAILLESVDGRTQLEQVRPVFAAKKQVFIDKPFAGSLRDARKIVRLARESGTAFFSSSSLRFASEMHPLKKKPDLGKLLGAFTYRPVRLEPHHPDLFWYGIHGVEMLYAGTLLVHKASHHFDEVNWWLDSTPVEVMAYGSLKF